MSDLIAKRVANRRRIYLLRHADVSYFDPDGTPCDPLTVPLSEPGREQARALAGAFARVPLDRVVTSGLLRTRQTAEAIVRERRFGIEDSPDLREIRAGLVPAWTPSAPRREITIEERFIDALTAATGADDRFLGGESFGAFRDRVVPAFEAILADPDWRTLLVVAHGGTNRVLLTHSLGSSLEHLGRFEQDPACVNILDIEPDGRALVRLVNYTVYGPLKEGLHHTTMESIFSDSRAAIQALASQAQTDATRTATGAGREDTGC